MNIETLPLFSTPRRDIEDDFSPETRIVLYSGDVNQFLDTIPDETVPAKYPGKRHYKGPNKGKLSGNPQGKNPTDILSAR